MEHTIWWRWTTCFGELINWKARRTVLMDVRRKMAIIRQSTRLLLVEIWSLIPANWRNCDFFMLKFLSAMKFTFVALASWSQIVFFLLNSSFHSCFIVAFALMFYQVSLSVSTVQIFESYHNKTLKLNWICFYVCNKLLLTLRFYTNTLLLFIIHNL